MTSHLLFWRQHPFLLIALTFLISSSASLFWQTPWNWIFPIFWSFYLLLLQKWPALSLLILGIVFCHFTYANKMKSGPAVGIYSIASLQPHQSPFGKGFVYKGTFYTANGSVPCDIYAQGNSPPHLADCDYFIRGNLYQKDAYHYNLKPYAWQPIDHSKSLAQKRYEFKESYRKFLSEKCPVAGPFLASLSTGDVEDRLLKFEFGKLGLQHLLSISGFHFGVLIAFAMFGLSLFLPRFWKFLSLLVILTTYYFFVGPFPAVQRSWLTGAAYLTAKLINRQTSALNLLGFTLAVELFFNPYIISNLGFQFSFASTGGILLLHPLFEEKLRWLLPKRNPKELPFFSKQAYLFSSFLRQSLALTLSVNAAILPILLYHFHQFPILSLIYNLFFPFCVGIAISLLLLSLTLQCLIPTIASWIFSCTSSFTETLLHLVSHPPMLLDYPLLIPCFAVWLIPIWLFSLLVFSISLTNRRV